MAEFFGGMQEKTSGRVEIKEMEPSVFAAMLRFIYTDAVPELDQKMEPGMATLARHLLASPDNSYGLDRLKAMCERRLAFAIDTGTAAATLALARAQARLCDRHRHCGRDAGSSGAAWLLAAQGDVRRVHRRRVTRKS